ncbi:hypothetical protein [Ferrovum sp. PN-J185]|nr:hypothetical protein [Ferrovum sp. PN-J185]
MPLMIALASSMAFFMVVAKQSAVCGGIPLIGLDGPHGIARYGGNP